MNGVRIVGTGSYKPKNVVKNDDFKKIIETSDEWIRTRTGITERHMSSGEATFFMGAEAAKDAIAEAGIDPSEIGLIIFSTVTPDYLTPSMACMVQREIGADGAMALDVNCGCTGFAYSFDMARRYLATDDDIKYALIIGAENLSKILDFEDRATCILFGDGAGAAIVSRADTMYAGFYGADGKGGSVLCAENFRPNNPFMDKDAVFDYGIHGGRKEGLLYQDGKEVYKFAVKIMPFVIEKACAKAGIAPTGLDLIIPHQANTRIIQTAAETLGLPMEKFHIVLDRFGNTSSASIPLAFDDAVKCGRVKRGDKVCFAGFGAGLTYGASVFEY